MLRRVLESAETIKWYRGRLDVSCHGYDSDQRELWEIPEVRSFVARLDEEFPFWLYFMTRDGLGLFFIGRCFLLPMLTPEADAKHNGPRLAGLFERRWLPAMNQMVGHAGLSESDILELRDSALEYFIQGPTIVPGRSGRMEALITYVQEGGRICPMPQKWMEMYDLLPKERSGGPKRPGVPLILAAWWEASPAQKQQRLIEQIRYAAATRCFEQIDSYLRSLPERAWFHGHDG